ncbi:MAG: AAA family ATPase [Dehalococcoidia bacterium]|nr:AAA family ATPase [Dehalococcoidia bacterium]
MTGTDPFIGRTQELAELSVALDTALEGRGGLVMLAGEPGIGKTRLAEELDSIARDRGALVARGACYEGGGTPPYWPWIQTVRSLLSERDSRPELEALGAGAARIAEIVPEIHDIVPDLAPRPDTDPGQARFQFFDSMTAFLNNVAESQPMVVVLDDLHWADQSSLDLLEFVAQGVLSGRVLLIGGYRDMELSRKRPLSKTLASLARVRGYRRIPVRGLDREDVARLVEAVGGFAPQPALVEEIHDRTEGNPFFITEVARDLARDARTGVEGSGPSVGFNIPEGVREVIGARLDRLSDGCNEFLRSAAVIGREFDFVLLGMLLEDASERDLLDHVEEAIGAGILRELPGPGEKYDFTHALIHQTLVEELSAGRRVRLHARIVSSMEELYGELANVYTTELAHHSVAAETVVGKDKIVRYTQLAGEQATNAYAWSEARAYFEQALDALGKTTPVTERAALLSSLGRVELLSLPYPDIQRGWDNSAWAFDLYVELGNVESAVEVTKAMAQADYPASWVHGDANLLPRALELVSPDSLEAGYLLLRYGAAIRAEREDVTGSLAALEQSLEIAQRAGDRDLEFLVLNSLGEMKYLDRDYRGNIEASMMLMQLAGGDTQYEWQHRIHVRVAWSLVTLGDPEAALRHIEAALVLEKQFGSRIIPRAFGQHHIAFLRGDSILMAEIGEELDRECPDDAVIRLFVGIGAYQSEAPSDIDERIQAALGWAQNDPNLGQRLSGISALTVAGRMVDRPRVAAQTGAIARSILSQPSLAPHEEAIAREGAGLAAVATGDLQEAKEHYRFLASPNLTRCFYRNTDRQLGLLAHTAGMPDESATHFDSALEFARKAGYHMEVVWTCHDYAESLLDENPPSNVDRAVSLIDDGLETARELGLAAIERRLISLQEKAALLATPTPTYPAGLSAREVEVLRLLAAGQTNREIAGVLVLSARTVERHISNLYTKINVRNRAEATSFALNELSAPPTP